MMQIYVKGAPQNDTAFKYERYLIHSCIQGHHAGGVPSTTHKCNTLIRSVCVCVCTRHQRLSIYYSQYPGSNHA